MNTIICRAAIAAALFSLVGCGLKGPLYFPPEKKSGQPQKTQQTPVAQYDVNPTTDHGVRVGIRQ